MPYKDPNDPRRKASEQKYYEKNKARVKADAKAAKQALIAEVRQLKSTTPCTDCGHTYPFYVMQFDHIANDKVDNIATMVNTGNRKAVMAEIAKCELVCANCHAVRTWNRLQA